MREMARAALEEGAFGMTSGLIYPPGVYSTSGEVEEIARGLTERRGLYLSHMRNESSGVVESVRETIAVAERAGIPAQVLHHKATGRANHGKVRETLALLEEARERGVDMTVDQYPYTAGSTTLRSILPPWVNEGGLEKLMERLRDPVLRERIRREILTTDGWENMLMSCGGPEGVLVAYTPETPEFEGKRLPEIGEMTGRDPLDAAFEVILANRGSDTACYFHMDEDDVKYVLAHPLVMVASDTIPPAPGAKCHPRTNGAFPRVLGRYVREEKVLGLEEAVRKMSGFPAARLGLQKKGLVKPGMDADLVLFNPDTVRDGATFEDPFGEPEGISSVFVAGKLAVKRGVFTGATAGKVLRRS
jgi:N-acyl-D-amino-acid deacylase